MPEPEPLSPLPNEQATIDFLILGDFAQATEGKLTVVGAGWTLVHAPQYPIVFPFGLGIGILIPWAETNRKHHFDFRISGEASVQERPAEETWKLGANQASRQE